MRRGSPDEETAHSYFLTIDIMDHQATAVNSKLSERTRVFAKDVRDFVSKTPRTIASLSDCRNLIRSSGAIGANYVDADSAPSTRSFVTRIRNCRKEARQSQLWLRLLDNKLEASAEDIRKKLLNEAYELDRIFSAVITETLDKAASQSQESIVRFAQEFRIFPSRS